MKRTLPARALVAGLAAAAIVLPLAACGGGSSAESEGGDKSTYTVWDPYPQFDDGSAWVKLLQSCGEKNGVQVKRTGYDTTDLTNKALLAAQQDNAPDVLVVDNPVVSTLADAGVLVDNDELGLEVGDVKENILGAGEIDGKTYGEPVGANTLALYYNQAILDEAGVDPASISTWDDLTAALEQVKAAGKKGITFSAIGTEEGSFQFLPWFWGSGAELTELDSADGTSALDLWTSWLQDGLAPNSVINNTQTTSWEEFLAGDFAFAENGTWQIQGAKDSDLDWGVIPIPSKDGSAVAPAPTGGEFVTVPAQSDTASTRTSAKIVECLTSPENALETDTTLGYVSALPEVQSEQASNPDLTVWIEAVNAARGRTADGLGTDYPKISEQMWNAVQASLTGSADPAEALKAAQAKVG